MDEMYAAGLPADVTQPASNNTPSDQNENGETMLLKRWNGKLIAESFKLPELEIEIARAVDQVEAMVKGEVKVEEQTANEKVAAAPALESPSEKQ